MNKTPEDIEKRLSEFTRWLTQEDIMKVRGKEKNKAKLEMENEALKLRIENLKLDKQKLRKQCNSFAIGIVFIMLSIIIATIIELIKRGQI